MQLELQVPKVNEVILVHLEMLDSQAIQEHRETPVSLGQKEHKVSLEPLESTDRQARLELEACLASKVILVWLGLLDPTVSQEHQVQLVAEAMLACRVKRVSSETLERLDQWDKQACKVILVCLDQQVREAHQGSKVRWVRRAVLARSEQPERQDLVVLLARADQLVILGFQVLQVNKVHKARWVRSGHEAVPECGVPLVDKDSPDS